MEPKLVTLPTFTVVGLRISGQPGSPDFSALWQNFLPRIGEIPFPSGGRVAYGLMDNFDQVDGKMDYMACVAV